MPRRRGDQNRHPMLLGGVLRDTSSGGKEAFAEQLRAHQTPAERMMGRVLLHLGIQAEPQVLLRGYIVDFLDEANRVVFEVDGGVHGSPGARKADAKRDRVLTRAGYRVMHFSNEEVRHLMTNVAEMVRS